MAVSANIYVQDTALAPAAISGVVVNVYDGVTLAFVTSATTGVDGLAALLLPAATYEARFFKQGVIFPNPVRFEIKDPLGVGETNDFDVSGTLTTLPVATDPRVCRCTGRFMGLANTPLEGVTVCFSAKGEAGTQTPKIVDGNLVSEVTRTLKTDSSGYLTIDLVRGGEFYVYFSGEEDQSWNIKVPDRSSINLIDLLFPTPMAVQWDADVAPGNAVSVAVGASLEIPYVILYSDYETSDLRPNVLTIDNSDATVVQVESSTTTGILFIKGLVVGTSTIVASVNLEQIPARIPAPGEVPPHLLITVTA
jgi:hypothetical protein